MRQHDRSTDWASRKRTRGSLSPGGNVETKGQFISRIPFNSDWGSRDENVCKRSGGIRTNAGCGSSESPTKNLRNNCQEQQEICKGAAAVVFREASCRYLATRLRESRNVD